MRVLEFWFSPCLTGAQNDHIDQVCVFLSVGGQACPKTPLPDFHNAKPFVKWVGGKRSLLPELMSRVPKKFNNYYEPFVGGGALFFALKNEGRINSCGGGGQAFLSDINFDLINTYQVIQRDSEPLILEAKTAHAKITRKITTTPSAASISSTTASR